MLILFNKYINTIIYIFIYISLLYCLLLCSHAAGGCAPVTGAGILLAGCRAPMLQVDVSPWLVPVSFRLVLLSFLVAGGCVPVAGGASWHPRPHIHSRAPWRVRTSLLSAAGLAVEIRVSKE